MQKGMHLDKFLILGVPGSAKNRRITAVEQYFSRILFIIIIQLNKQTLSNKAITMEGY